MKNLMFLIIIFAFAFTSCSKDELPIIDDKNVNISNIQAGQISVYKEYTNSCEQFGNNFNFTGNQITLEIKAQENNLIAVESYLNDAGTVLNSVEFEISNDAEGNLYIPDRLNSSLFFFYDNDKITTNPTDIVSLKQEGCKINYADNIFAGNDIGKLNKFKIGEISNNEMTVVSCEPIVEIEAYLMYNQDKLYTSHQVFISDFMGQVDGFITGYQLVE